jgi:uncharacterized protein
MAKPVHSWRRSASSRELRQRPAGLSLALDNVKRVHVGALEIEVHIPAAGSLKAKRSVVKHIVETSRQRFGVSASEVAYHELWQRAGLGFSVVAPSAGHAEKLLDQVERFVWSHPEIEVISSNRRWLEADGD